MINKLRTICTLFRAQLIKVLLSLGLSFITSQLIIPYLKVRYPENMLFQYLVTHSIALNLTLVFVLLLVLSAVISIYDIFYKKPFNFTNDRFAYYTITHRLTTLYSDIFKGNNLSKYDDIPKKWKPSECEISSTIWDYLTSDKKDDTAKQMDGELFAIEDTETYDELFDNKVGKVLTKYANNTFSEAPFIIAEHYFYYHILKRLRINGIFTDPYRYSKEKIDLECITKKYPQKAHLEDYLILCVFANTSDLSQTGSHTDLIDNCTLMINDTKKVLSYLKKKPQLEKVDIITDNCGVELYSDIMLGLYLIKKRKAKQVVFHVRIMPQFVSDTIVSEYGNDFEDLFKTIGDANLRQEFIDYLNQHVIEIRSSYYWNLPVTYVESKKHFRKLIGKSDLIVVKGDLNYRKLLGDRPWTFSPFKRRCRELGYPVLALRAIKSSLVEGVGIEAKDKILNSLEGMDGQYGIIRFHRPSRIIRWLTARHRK